MRTMMSHGFAGSGDVTLPDRIAAAGRSYAHGASRAILFGSVARGEEHRDRDVDLLLVWPSVIDEDTRWDASMRIARVVDDVAGRVCIPLVYTDQDPVGAAGRTRTPNLLIRSQTLCPFELRPHDLR